MSAGPEDRAAGRGYPADHGNGYVYGSGAGYLGHVAGHGFMRASDADRERVVDALKAAFVHGQLTKHELGMRTGQALAARTCGELASIMAGVPARAPAGALVRIRPPVPIRKKVVRWSACVIIPPALGAAFLTYYGGFIVLFLLAFVGAVLTAGPMRSPDSRRRW